MGCAGCGQARQQFIHSARRFDIRGAANAIRQGVAINVDKVKGTYVDKPYGPPVQKAKPYQRKEPDRTT